MSSMSQPKPIFREKPPLCSLKGTNCKAGLLLTTHSDTKTDQIIANLPPLLQWHWKSDQIQQRLKKWSKNFTK